MFKKIIVFVAVMAIAANLWSQSTLNWITVDKETYRLWQEQQWKPLIRQGNEALKQGIDFYYLRVRMGIAHYELRHYHAAIRQFEKAISFSNQEEYLTEYLYFAYLNAGRKEEAKKLASKFSQALKEKTHTQKRPFISELQLFYNYDLRSDPTTAASYSISIDSMIRGAQYVGNNHHYINFGLTHEIGSAFTLKHAYSFISQSYFVYKQSDTLQETEPNYISNVHQYYISGNIRLAKNWNLGLGLHYIGVRYPIQTSGTGMGRRGQQKTVGTDSDISLFLHLKKDFPYVSTMGSFYFSTLNNSQQLQTDLTVNTYPLGNLDLYTSTILSFQYSDIEEQQWVLQQEIGGKICKYLWLEGKVTLGNVRDFLTNEGYVVNNGMDLTRYSLSSRVIIPFNNKIQLQLGYGFSEKTSVFLPTYNNEISFNPISFSTHSITGGFIWNFSKPAKY